MTNSRTFLFMPESAYGPTNNCIGIGNELLKRGHRVVFAAESSWQGKLAPLGFEEALVDFAPPAEDGEAEAGDFWKEYIKAISPGIPEIHPGTGGNSYPAHLGRRD